MRSSAITEKFSKKIEEEWREAIWKLLIEEIEMNESDILTFRNHKGEEKKITRQEFRNAARGQQDIDHRPTLMDTPIPNLNSGLDYVQKATPKEKLFELTHINNKPVQ